MSRTSRESPASWFPLAAPTRRLLDAGGADHTVRLNGQVVRYVLRRAKRRSIGFIVGPQGLRVSAPRWTGLAEIEAGLASKADWILRKLAEQGERLERREASRVEWKTGAVLAFLGEPLRLVVHEPPVVDLQTRTGRGLLPDVRLESGAESLLHVHPRHAASPHDVRDAVVVWLKHEALRLFEQRSAHFAERLQVRYGAIRLSSAQTRWGSATSSGTIRLSWRLIHFPLATIDYVVAHELAHLREMNHGPRFWAVVESVVPDHRERRASLRSELLPLIE